MDDYDDNDDHYHDQVYFIMRGNRLSGDDDDCRIQVMDDEHLSFQKRSKEGVGGSK